MRRTMSMFICTCALLAAPLTANAAVPGPVQGDTVAPPQQQALRARLQEIQKELAQLKAELQAARPARGPQPDQSPRARRAPRQEGPRGAMRDGQGRQRGRAYQGRGDQPTPPRQQAMRRALKQRGQGQAAPAPRGQLRRGGEFPQPRQLRGQMHAPWMRGQAPDRMRGGQFAPRGRPGGQFAPNARGRRSAPHVQGMPTPRQGARRFRGRQLQDRPWSPRDIAPQRRDAIRRYHRMLRQQPGATGPGL